ncbi:F-box/kelch-repeat protein At3g13680 [Capsella rubella]|uniref:F-box/kelch-repeat protein At3g13680 n=1 Tax=Capsella rubella TaxID=81985 RepID=UPI000CD54446|nr:F-box/kelch-repeat protein At3g13680 [Capsella rubella]
MMMFDLLPEDLVEEILSRVQRRCLRAVRSTCKRWNCLSKNRILCKGEARQEYLGIMVKESKVFSKSYDLHGIQNKEHVVTPSIKQIKKFSKLEISQVFHCDGLLLLVGKEVNNNTRLIVWNPYMSQIRYIQPRTNYDLSDVYALGYDNKGNHKILMMSRYGYEIFDFKSNSWKVLDDVHHSDIMCHDQSVSLKGNTYFYRRKVEGLKVITGTRFFVCFDFTRERFGPCFPLPSNFNVKGTVYVTLSSIREEQLASLCIHWYTYTVEIQVTTKIEQNEVLWRKFLTVDISDFYSKIFTGSFFIDQEKKLAVIFARSIFKGSLQSIAYITGENGLLRQFSANQPRPRSRSIT